MEEEAVGVAVVEVVAGEMSGERLGIGGERLLDS